MKIAIIGSGISGLSAAYYLHKQHDIHLFESDSRLGGHTATKQIRIDGIEHAIDTGFIVFNDWTYPNFIKLMSDIGVKSIPTSMGFSVTDKNSDYEYAGTNLWTLFAQKRNIFSVAHWKMIRDILRFNKEAIVDFEAGDFLNGESLGHYLTRKRYSNAFIDRYLVPMGSAIWSATQTAMLEFPIEFFVRFFKNHGLLNVTNRPQWHVIEGGSSAYIPKLTQGFKDRIRLNTKIESISRIDNKVHIYVNNQVEIFDHIIFACHSDQALRLLADATPQEHSILSAIPYQNNTVILHTDTRLLPKRPSTWCSWNYALSTDKQALPILTYSMNILQHIQSHHHFCVTLNDESSIDSSKILGRYEYAHPVFSAAAIDAQGQWECINGVKQTWFAGAYWFNGFHEDGVKSALRIVEKIQHD